MRNNNLQPRFYRGTFMMVVSSVCMCCFPYYKVIYILIGNPRPAKPESEVTKTNFISFAQS